MFAWSLNDEMKGTEGKAFILMKLWVHCASWKKGKVTAPPHQAFTESTKYLKETEGDKQSLSWPTQHQGTELATPLIQWAR